MKDFFEITIKTIIDGLSIGGVYALIALGYTMVYGIAKMLNFAHGDIIMVGAYAIFVFYITQTTEITILSIVLAIIICIIFGIAIEYIAYRPLRGASPLAVLITAIGVSYFLQSIVSIIWGTSPKMVQFPKLPNLKIGGIIIDGSTILTLFVAILVMVLLTIFVNKTKIGKAMRATSEDRVAAELMGINVNMIISITFAIGSALAGLASAFYIMKSPSVTTNMGSLPGIKAFTAAVIGGIGSIPGAMIGGLILGLIETICNAIPIEGLSNYTIAIEFAMLIIILLVRPSGILGKKRKEKV